MAIPPLLDPASYDRAMNEPLVRPMRGMHGVEDVSFASHIDEVRDAVQYRLVWTFHGARKNISFVQGRLDRLSSVAPIDPLEMLVREGPAVRETNARLEGAVEGLTQQVRSLAAALTACHALLSQHNIPIPGVAPATPAPTTNNPE